MAIRFLCQCGKRIKVPDEFAGRPARCKVCGRGFVIPAAPAEDKPGVYPPLEPHPAPPGDQQAPAEPRRPGTAVPLEPAEVQAGGAQAAQPAGPQEDKPVELIPVGQTARALGYGIQTPAGEAVLTPAQPRDVAAGPPPQAAARKTRAKTFLILAGVGGVAVIAGIVVAVVLLSGGIGGSTGPGLGQWAHYVPDKAMTIHYLNVQKLSQANLVKGARSGIPGMEDIEALKIADVRELFAFDCGDARKQVVVFRTGSDQPLKQLAPQAAFRTAGSTQYAPLGSGRKKRFLARTQPATYCLSASEPDLKAALQRFADKKTPKLDKHLQRMIDRASRNDHWRAMMGLRLWGFGGMMASGGGFRLGDEIEYESLFLFDSSGDAKRHAEQRREILKHQLSWMSKASGAAGGLDKAFQQRARILKSSEISQSGQWVRLAGSCNVQDVREGGAAALNLVLCGER